MFNKAMRQEAQSALEAELTHLHQAHGQALDAARALDEARDAFMKQSIPGVESWMERFSTHKTIFELDEVLTEVKTTQSTAPSVKGLPGVALGGAVVLGGAATAGQLVGGAAAAGASSVVLIPLGFAAGGLLLVGGFVWAIRRVRRASTDKIMTLQARREEIAETREALERFTRRAQALQASILKIQGEVRALVKELSTVSHLYVQYWTWRQRQALAELMDAMRRYKKILQSELVFPESGALIGATAV